MNGKVCAYNGLVTREYRQFCGLARAMELVGGRWTLLIVRDLLGGPKRFTDLRKGLPGIPTNVLSARLRELEEDGIVRRAVLSRPASGLAYELTEYGADLEAAVVTLGMWGARSMESLREGDFYSTHALALGLRGMFTPHAAADVDCAYELRVEGGEPLRVHVHDGTVSFGDDAEVDVVIDTDPDTMLGMLNGALTVDEAETAGRARITGSPALAARFFDIFHIGTTADDPSAHAPPR